MFNGVTLQGKMCHHELSIRMSVVFRIILCFSFLVVTLPFQADGCGWWGDGDSDLSEDPILVGDDGKPVPDEEMSVNDPAAQTEIGNRFRNGEGVGRNYAEAVRWYRKAAELGFAGAQNNLATMYEQGLGVPKDEYEALKWYRRAAEQGDGKAQHSLGALYRDGRGVSQDYVKAAEWMRKAAEQGHEGAFKDMGEMYWKGLGVSQNDVLAYMWWKIAAQSGDKESERLCNIAAAKMTPERVSEAEKMAQEWTPKKQ